MERKALGILAVCWCVAMAVPTFAHHSMIAYEGKELVTEIEGTVTAVSWRNPHMRIQIAVPKDGKTETWEIEGGSVTGLVSAGVSASLLKPGTKVKAYGRRHRDHTRSMAVLDWLEINGRVYGRNSAGGDLAGEGRQR